MKNVGWSSKSQFLNRYKSTVDCWISLIFDTAIDHFRADNVQGQRVSVEGQGHSVTKRIGSKTF